MAFKMNRPPLSDFPVEKAVLLCCLRRRQLGQSCRSILPKDQAAIGNEPVIRETQNFGHSLVGIDGTQLAGDNQVTIAGGEVGTQTAVVKADAGATTTVPTPISFEIADIGEAGVTFTAKSRFWMP